MVEQMLDVGVLRNFHEIPVEDKHSVLGQVPLADVTAGSDVTDLVPPTLTHNPPFPATSSHSATPFRCSKLFF